MKQSQFFNFDRIEPQTEQAEENPLTYRCRPKTKEKTTYFENKSETSGCRDCYFRAHFKEWIKVEVPNIHRRG